MEEMKNEVMETVNDEVEVIDTDEVETGEGIGKLAVAGAVLAGAAALGAIAYKKGKGKLRDWQIRKLEKAGYQVTKPETEEVSEAEIVSDDETE